MILVDGENFLANEKRRTLFYVYYEIRTFKLKISDCDDDKRKIKFFPPVKFTTKITFYRFFVSSRGLN